MGRAVFNVFLFVVLVALVGLNILKGRNLAHRNIEVLPEMVRSIPFDAYAANSVFADGKTLQPPVEGTIARDQTVLHYDATPDDAQRAGVELVNPYALDDQDAISRGAEVYAVFCQHCHGATGKGGGAVARRGFPPPPSLYTDNARDLPDGRLFHIITYGQGNMPAHGPLIAPADRWKAVLHIRRLQAKAELDTPQDTTEAGQP